MLLAIQVVTIETIMRSDQGTIRYCESNKVENQCSWQFEGQVIIISFAITHELCAERIKPS